MAKRKTTDEFISEMKSVNPSIKVLGEYKGCKSKIEVCCGVCKNVWSAQPSNLLQGFGCPECARVHAGDYHKRNQDSFIQDLQEKNPNIEVIGQYINARTLIKVKCKKCGYEWKAHPDVLINRSATCINCKKSGTSQVEQFLLEAFRQIFGILEVKSRVKNVIGMELDIYIPKKKIAIEYGSWYWHKNNVQRDIEKRKRCRDKGIRLFTILDGIDCPAPFNDCYVFSYPLSLTKIEELVGLVSAICLEIGSQESVNLEWNEIRKTAINSVDADKDKDFKKRLKKVNPSVSVLGSYIGYSKNIKCQCNVCGFLWETSPANLLGNGGKKPTACPECARIILKKTNQKTNDDYIEELKLKNPMILPLENYSGAQQKILVRCLKCGFEWKTPAEKLLQGRGCPKCSKVYRRSEQDFLDEMKKVNSDVTIISKYVKTEENVKARCNVCGFEWEVTPASLLGRKGRKPSSCPKCRRKKISELNRKTNEEFLQELSQKNPSVIALTKYQKNHQKILAKCSVCGYEWMVTPAHLLSGTGCPKKRSHGDIKPEIIE